MPGALEECCAYFCTGLSVFGVLGLFFMGYTLKSGNHWFLGVSKEGADASAMACFYAGVIYAVYLFYCGAKVMSWSGKKGDGSEELMHSDV
ncbi:hypothetical protein EMIHUDRAFT_441848 [Emiliania huxleyi CCMP1516]|uniref:MARVEL domain-containing protein n=3 Tax=Emiliania huxleyi TaxID=2903 RepID=A0A0D3HZZ8_EMIH1|nr:hypothetical protein EMIHUDRAFT_453869 [Emiliania huxleyi CCMP1516]XP_005785071.1 hypothetical protein EMIHUDRAFT_441848 [Emiliania huxleyi CCMP1516]EOD04583.1 hypothetical protein EMIHUDRAFT_453869 [Emiliania huxleyi CCMP1516]EOD32642.1 hypothetical protein EMIHUDRAFT_441848 [Emiliania huxleyi CCMP1516]|eukprot:XP_005757012.1 hypothetical protein EMIHUDRAFT_453869 [Emiliania huxleyi CCMP1516]